MKLGHINYGVCIGISVFQKSMVLLKYMGVPARMLTLLSTPYTKKWKKIICSNSNNKD